MMRHTFWRSRRQAPCTLTSLQAGDRQEIISKAFWRSRRQAPCTLTSLQAGVSGCIGSARCRRGAAHRHQRAPPHSHHARHSNTQAHTPPVAAELGCQLNLPQQRQVHALAAGLLIPIAVAVGPRKLRQLLDRHPPPPPRRLVHGAKAASALRGSGSVAGAVAAVSACLLPWQLPGKQGDTAVPTTADHTSKIPTPPRHRQPHQAAPQEGSNLCLIVHIEVHICRGLAAGQDRWRQLGERRDGVWQLRPRLAPAQELRGWGRGGG